MINSRTEREMLQQQFSNPELSSIESPDDNDMPSQNPEVLDEQSE